MTKCLRCGETACGDECNGTSHATTRPQMTNEKDREEARRIIAAYFGEKNIGLPPDDERIVASEIARIRTEAVSLKVHDAPVGFVKRLFAMTMEDRDYILSLSAAIAEAVKAERERILLIIKACLFDWYKDGGGKSRLPSVTAERMYAIIEAVILSDDHEASKHDMDCERELMGSAYPCTCEKPVKEEGRG